MRELQGAVVVVVGATGGIGRPLVSELGRRGAVVLGAGRQGPDIVCDLRDVDAGQAVVRGALGLQGRLDGVVNAAGIVAFGDLVATDPAVIEELFLTNALGPLWLARAVLPVLAERRGFFATITGVVAEQSLAHLVPYCASKAALSHALPGLRREARRLGVHVADFRPPHTETGLTTRAIAGTAPSFGAGRDPEAVARRMVDAIEADEAELPSTAF
ncbi:MAG: SDR family NAD(P)-dependent oxidoreductase [Acidimicrobiales bacterium]